MSRQHESGCAASRPPAGFTLIEVMAAILLTSIVIAVASGLYLNLSQSSLRAQARMREELRAAAALDRIARDLEGAFLLVKPEELDPLAHPWFFVAQSQNGAGDGADQIRFFTRSTHPPGSETHVSDLAQVAYLLASRAEGGWDLMRWSSPGPPADEPGFPSPDDPHSLLLAEDLDSFAMRFLGEDGEWTTEWDSSQLLQSSLLPRAVEFELSFASGAEAEERGPGEAEAEVRLHRRLVVLPLPPVDLPAMIAEALGEEEQAGEQTGTETPDDESAEAPGKGSIAACVARNRALCDEMLGAQRCDQLSLETGEPDASARDMLEILGCR